VSARTIVRLSGNPAQELQWWGKLQSALAQRDVDQAVGPPIFCPLDVAEACHVASRYPAPRRLDVLRKNDARRSEFFPPV
jgi:hypothetical protein